MSPSSITVFPEIFLIEMTTLYCRPRAIFTDLRHIFPIFFWGFLNRFLSVRTLPIMSGTARAWWYSHWIHEDAVGRGFPKPIHLGWWIFPTLAFQKRFMRPGSPWTRMHNLYMHGTCMVFEYLTFWWSYLFIFFVFWMGGGEWTGVPWLGMWILADALASKRCRWQETDIFGGYLLQATRGYHFFGEPLIARGGRYNLCWCGPPAEGSP